MELAANTGGKRFLEKGPLSLDGTSLCRVEGSRCGRKAPEVTYEEAQQAAQNQSEVYKQSVELRCEGAKQAYEHSYR